MILCLCIQKALPVGTGGAFFCDSVCTVDMKMIAYCRKSVIMYAIYIKLGGCRQNA